MDAVELGQQALATGLIAKAAVDLYRKVPIPSPDWALPLAAFAFGILGSIGLTYADRMELDGPNIIKAIILGFLGGVSAILVTEWHKFVRKDDDAPVLILKPEDPKRGNDPEDWK